MPKLILINGAPGTGKSTVAYALAEQTPMMLALDIDQLKHALGGWAEHPISAGLQARRLATAMISIHLSDGYDVVIGQYLARTPFIEELAALAEADGASFVEIILELNASALAGRIAQRQAKPDRPEHAINNQLVEPKDADLLVESLRVIPEARPRTILIDASSSVDVTLARLSAVLNSF